MGVRIIPFGESRTDELVKEWLATKGIKPEDVMAYNIRRGSDDLPTITLTMHYDESKE